MCIIAAIEFLWVSLFLQAAIKQMSDPASSGNIHHTKVSLMIKLPDKQTTIMSVPGLWVFDDIRELKNHDEVHDDDVCWLGKDWNENVSFGGKKET